MGPLHKPRGFCPTQPPVNLSHVWVPKCASALVHLDFASGDLQAVSDAIRETAQIRLSTDGAMKRDGQAAAGMAIMAYFNGRGPTSLYRAGRILGVQKSAFVSELLALSWGLSMFSQLL